MPENTQPPGNGNGKRLIAPPSNSTTMGTLGGVGMGPIIVWLITTFTGVEVPPEIAASIGAVIGNLIGYFFEGGRKL